MITYVKGDATQPLGNDCRIIAHVCNNVGGWGKGFVVAISKRWKEPERLYRSMFRDGKIVLGETAFSAVDENLLVANMCAQVGYGSQNQSTSKTNEANKTPPIRYDALRTCLKQVRDEAIRQGASVHMPRIGCGLAGGRWEDVEPIINDELHDVNVTIYDL